MSAIETRQLFNFIQGSDISGVSSYDIWKSLNPNGTEAEFLEYIRSGPQGEQGPEGPQGSSARVYFLMCSDNVIERTIHDTLLPSSITFNAYYREGTNTAKINYTGRFIIQETTDGYTWTNKYTSNVDESSVNFIPSSAEVKFIKCKLYAAGGTTEELDVQNIPILTDAGLIKVLVATLSNEAHTISCDYNGENCNYEGCNTQVKVYSGVTEVTQSATFNINTSKGVTGAWDENTHVYTITDLSVENGYVDFEITFGGNSIVKRFTVAKIKAGANGEPGSSTYDIWVSSGHEGDVNDFLEFLKGEPGPKGQSTYEVWTGLGNTGTAQEFIEFLKGEPGEAGPQGEPGSSTYDIWVSSGHEGDVNDFLEFLKGKDGTSVTILGTKNTESELPIEGNNNGNGYIINGDLFVWGSDGWTNVGQVRGPQGEQGPEGPQGPKGQSTYDIWKSIEGNEDGTVQDFLNYLKDDGESNVSEETLAQIEKNKEDISQLTEKIADQLGATVPDYWKEELETKADAIQTAMEKAGRNKSAFLWYTDAHWVNGNSKVSPMLLNYLYMNTPMNKVNFGGDIIGDTLLATREEMKYLYEWRKAIKDLPNHHSVFGNHDMFDLGSVDYENDNYRYAFLLAPEETPDMVWGDGNYYYIDNHAEKTRYLYITYMTSDHTAMMAQGQFICDAIKGVSSGWHIVAIAHRWFQYSSSSTPTTGSIPAYETEIISVFDAYNARTTRSGSNYFASQDFTDGKGKVEFCIGGHIHADYDFFTDSGIPIIITTSDTNQNRVPDSEVDSGTEGTITESAVFGIIADYNEDVTKITIIGVGRGTSRVVRSSTVTPTSISGITYSGDTTVESTIDKSKFRFTVNYSDGTTSSVNGASTVTPTTIEVVGDNSVNITYVENGVTLTGTITIAGIAKPVENLLKLDRTYVTGTSGENIANNFDETKAYTNVAYGTGVFNTSSCTASNITENSVTVTESGIGGITVGYPINLPDLSTKSYKLSFDYEGVSGKKARVHWRGIYASGEFAGVNTVCDATGSGHIDADISNTNDYNKIVVYFSSNTGGTCNYTNVSLMEVN